MIYLDHAASAPPWPEVVRLQAEVAQAHPANPSAAHGPGAAAARLLEAARAQVAGLIGASPRELVFTSGGTEANALGVLGAARAARGRHVVTTLLEHPAVAANVAALEREGFAVTRVAPDRRGVVPAQAVLDAVTDDTGLVAVMWVNNELGTVQPVAELAAGLRARGARAHLHVDAVQAGALWPGAARALGASSLALSGHKLHGPRGVGALWLAPGARVEPLWRGGGHEGGLRSGTENLPAIAALGLACARWTGEASAAGPRIAALRDRLERKLCEPAGGLPVPRPTVAPDTPRAPHIASITVPGLPAEPLLHALEALGVVAAAGSACASRGKAAGKVSPALRALGVPERDAVLRFSLSAQTSPDEVEAAALAFGGALRTVAEVARSSAAPERRTHR